MRIEPISSYNYQPYVYKPSAIDSNSLSKVKRIGDDLLASKNDFSGLTEDQEPQETTNPLGRGQTVNFNNVLDRQMQMGRMNASRLVKPAPQEQDREEISQKAKQAEQPGKVSSYQMQRAVDAYQMFMTA